MTKRDFFILMIKMFGLFSVVTSLFSSLPGNISIAMLDLDIYSILWIAIAIIVIIGFFIVLLFKADKVVGILKLDDGFDDERIEFGNLKSTDIIKIGAFIIGGLLILDNIPQFLSHLFLAFRGDIIGLEYTTQDKFDWAVSGLNLIVGFLLVKNYNFVAKMFRTEKK